MSAGLARVTVSSPQRRVDVALPETVALAELLPELLSHAGEALADAGEQHGGWLLRRADGRVLALRTSLAAQGVRDGEVLHLVPARADWPELEYDDVVEAIAAGARRQGVGWSGPATRVAGLGTAGVALATGLAAVLRAGPPWPVPAAVALGTAAVLLVAGVLAARAYGAAGVGATLAGYALPYAFAGGLLLLAGSARPAGPGGAAGSGGPVPAGSAVSAVFGAPQLLVGSVALVLAALLGAMAAGAELRVFVAGVSAGAVGAVGALVALWSDASGASGPAVAAAVVLTLLVVGVAGVPLLAIRLGRLPVPAVATPADLADSGRGLPAQPDRAQVFAAVAQADEMLTGMLLGLAVCGAAAGAVLAFSAGFAGRLLVAVAAVAFLLRARLFVTVRQRLPLLGLGVFGLAALAGSAAFGARPAGYPAAALVALLVVAALVVAVAGTRYAVRAPSPYLGRAADLLDAVCVVAVLPIACAVLGLYSLVSRLIT